MRMGAVRVVVAPDGGVHGLVGASPQRRYLRIQSGGGGNNFGTVNTLPSGTPTVTTEGCYNALNQNIPLEFRWDDVGELVCKEWFYRATLAGNIFSVVEGFSDK